MVQQPKKPLSQVSQTLQPDPTWRRTSQSMHGNRFRLSLPLIKIQSKLSNRVCHIFNVRIENFFPLLLPPSAIILALRFWSEVIKITLKPYAHFTLHSFFRPLALDIVRGGKWNPRRNSFYRVWHCRERLSIIIHVTLHSTRSSARCLRASLDGKMTWNINWIPLLYLRLMSSGFSVNRNNSARLSILLFRFRLFLACSGRRKRRRARQRGVKSFDWISFWAIKEVIEAPWRVFLFPTHTVMWLWDVSRNSIFFGVKAKLILIENLDARMESLHFQRLKKISLKFHFVSLSSMLDIP